MNPSLTIELLEDRKHKRLYSSLKTDEDLIPDMIFDEDRIRKHIVTDMMVYKQKYHR